MFIRSLMGTWVVSTSELLGIMWLLGLLGLSLSVDVFSVLSGIYVREELLGPVTRRTLSSRM